ncbi:MAG: malto-oligosyltrehalose trehalohydrolase, partial [Candidatus Competibacterales bacterium]|nr:malto-oligosyltrehalose trehalohydrolase [Candidatus Competibacterales bacterium]
WHGRPWHETVLYELHVGSFTSAGDYDGVRARLDHLVEIGVTAVELMPLADFAGERNWGYDGVLPFAPDSAYGRPDQLKRLIDAAHGRGLQVFLDVVYNHFGPDGNFLHHYAPAFFTERLSTPWGAAIDFSRPEVRAFFIHNALYWLEEYRIDGLRLDAVHAIIDDSDPHVLEELAERVRAHFGDEREIHLVLENDANQARYLDRDDNGRARHYDAQWNDDIHHALHTVATGESGGYYEDYIDRPLAHLARCLASGFAYQGEPSPHRDHQPRGESSAHLPPPAFVNFIQNHDQIGNRALGERLTQLAELAAVRAIAAIALMAPGVPLLFMGEEWAASQPFLFFCDFHDELADAVREGRRREFARFPEFRDPAARERIPDPNDPETFARTVLDWREPQRRPHAEQLAFYRALLRLRHDHIVPRLPGTAGHAGTVHPTQGVLRVDWTLGDGSTLHLLARLADSPRSGAALPMPGRRLYTSDPAADPAHGALPPWTVIWNIAGTA